MHYADLVKKASIGEAETIMQEIYDEDPDYWPNGLSSKHFDGGLYLIREASTKDPAGFVGWQERTEGMDKIGYYSIGVSKKHRRRGFAKEAVNKIISEKSAGVDRVRALVVSRNKPSLGLAKSLDSEVQIKQASAVDLSDGIDNEEYKQLSHIDIPTLLSLSGGQVDPETRELLEESMPSSLGTAGVAGLSSGLASGLGTHLINKGDRPGLATGVGLGSGGLWALVAGLAQRAENKSNSEALDAAEKRWRDYEDEPPPSKEASSSKKKNVGKEICNIYESIAKKKLLKKTAGLVKSANPLGAFGRWLAGKTGGALAGRFIGGGLSGLGVGEVENRALGLGEGTSHINRILNFTTGGLMGGRKTLSPLAMWAPKTLGVYGLDKYLKSKAKEDDLMRLKLETANIDKETAEKLSGGSFMNSLKEMPTWAKWLSGGTAATLLGSMIYKNLKRDKPDTHSVEVATGKPGVINLEIPEQKISDDFYRSISRDLLFKNKELNTARTRQDADKDDDADAERQKRLALENKE